MPPGKLNPGVMTVFALRLWLRPTSATGNVLLLLGSLDEERDSVDGCVTAVGVGVGVVRLLPAAAMLGTSGEKGEGVTEGRTPLTAAAVVAAAAAAAVVGVKWTEARLRRPLLLLAEESAESRS